MSLFVSLCVLAYTTLCCSQLSCLHAHTLHSVVFNLSVILIPFRIIQELSNYGYDVISVLFFLITYSLSLYGPCIHFVFIILLLYDLKKASWPKCIVAHIIIKSLTQLKLMNMLKRINKGRKDRKRVERETQQIDECTESSQEPNTPGNTSRFNLNTAESVQECGTSQESNTPSNTSRPNPNTSVSVHECGTSEGRGKLDVRGRKYDEEFDTLLAKFTDGEVSMNAVGEASRVVNIL